MKKMGFLCICVGLTLLMVLAGVSSSSVNLTLNRVYTDKMEFHSKLDVTGLDMASVNKVTFEKNDSSGQYQPVCLVFLNNPSVLPLSSDCKCFSENAQLYECVYNMTADTNNSGHRILVRLRTESGYVVSNAVTVYGVSRPSLTLMSDISQQPAPCNNGYRHNKENIVFRASFNVTAVHRSSLHSVTFEKRGKNQWYSVCPVFLSNPSDKTSRLDCLCFSENGQLYECVYNMTADTNNNGYHVLARLSTKSGNVVSNEVVIPAAYDENSTNVIATISNKNGTIYSVTNLTSFPSICLRHEIYTLNICCSNPATTCYPRILYDGFFIATADQSGCASLSFTREAALSLREGCVSLSFTSFIRKTELSQRDLVLSYSLCSQEGDMHVINYLQIEIGTIETSLAVENLFGIGLIICGIIITLHVIRDCKKNTVRGTLFNILAGLCTCVCGIAVVMLYFFKQDDTSSYFPTASLSIQILGGIIACGFLAREYSVSLKHTHSTPTLERTTKWCRQNSAPKTVQTKEHRDKLAGNKIAHRINSAF